MSIRSYRCPLDIPAPNGAQSAIDVVRLSLHIPYTGTRNVFKTQPSRVFGTPNPEAALTDDEVIIAIAAGPDEDGQAAEGRLLLLEQNLQQWVNMVNSDVAALKCELGSHARTLIGKRIAVVAPVSLSAGSRARPRSRPSPWPTC